MTEIVEKRKEKTEDLIQELEDIEGVQEAGVNDHAMKRALTSLYVTLKGEAEDVKIRPDFKKYTNKVTVEGVDIEPNLSSIMRKINNVLRDAVDEGTVYTFKIVRKPEIIYDHNRSVIDTSKNRRESTGLYYGSMYLIDVEL